jgi:hypothetical protein
MSGLGDTEEEEFFNHGKLGKARKGRREEFTTKGTKKHERKRGSNQGHGFARILEILNKISELGFFVAPVRHLFWSN